MHTLNTRQLLALSALAPGTLALSEASDFALMTFLPTDDDAARCGWWALDIDQAGNATLRLNGGGNVTYTHRNLIDLTREQREGERLSEHFTPYCGF